MKTILIVDDNPTIRFLLNLDLSSNYKIVEASHGLEGLDMFRKHSPHLIIADYHMPLLDGISMVREIRSLNPFVKIIAHTSLFNNLRKAEFLAAGANLCLAKPCSLPDLEQAISSLLNTASLRSPLPLEPSRTRGRSPLADEALQAPLL